MASFYGGASAYGASSSGTSNYNELSNKPITNLVGLESSPIVLYDLDFGNYIIQGAYSNTAIDSIKQFSSPKSLSIEVDEETGKKVALYFTVENEITYLNQLVFFNENLCIVKKTTWESSSSSDISINLEGTLPEVGEEGKLYVVGNAIYVWDGQGYVNLTQPTWENY
jgi:hypothetical protein